MSKLRLETKTIQVYTFTHNGRTIHLIDTPGFDDTYRSDSEVLRDLAFFLTSSYDSGLRLTGIIYLHPITATRMFGSALKNLRTFRKLCGSESLSSVVMATTMWENESPEVGHQREADLKMTAEWWGGMIGQGSQVMRHSNDHNSAINIISSLVNRNTTTVLGLQKEMVDEKKSLQDTEAGREVESELAKERQRFERQLEDTRKEMEEAIANNDKKHMEEIAKEERKFEAKIKAIEKGRKELRTNMEKLIAERERMHKEELAKYYQELHESRESRGILVAEVAELKRLAKEQAAQTQRHKEELERALEVARDGYNDNVKALSVLALETLRRQDEQAAKAQKEMAAEMKAREAALVRKFSREQELRERRMLMAADQAIFERRREQQQMFPSSAAYLPCSAGPASAYQAYGMPPHQPPLPDHSAIVAATIIGGTSLVGPALSICVVM